jgi:pilus assembly protein Flp/PilA
VVTRQILATSTLRGVERTGDTRAAQHRKRRDHRQEYKSMKTLFARFVREEEGQDIIEYALLAAFISVVAWLILQSIGGDVQTMYSNVQKATKDGAAASGS